MERTAMQELIDFAWENLDAPIMTTIRKAEQLLSKEREQIVEAHLAGDPNEIRYDAEQYYSSKYEQK